MLGWSVRDLAQKAGLHRNSIGRIEAASAEPDPRGFALNEAVRALQAGGVIFLPCNGDGPGVRLTKGPAAVG
jgi:transcriptional regulator with XRE-family HTH domain